MEATIELDYKANEIDSKVDKMALRESCSYVNASLVEQESNMKCKLLAYDFKLSADDDNCLQENNKQLCAEMLMLKIEVCDWNVRCDNLKSENKWLRQKNARCK